MDAEEASEQRKLAQKTNDDNRRELMRNIDEYHHLYLRAKMRSAPEVVITSILFSRTRKLANEAS